MEGNALTCGFLTDNGNMSISLANSLSFFDSERPRPGCFHRLVCVASLPMSDSKMARALEGRTVRGVPVLILSSS